MKTLPTPPAPGKPVSATLIRQLIAAIRERTILPGRNSSVKRGPNGTVVNFGSSSTTTAASPAPLHPFMVKGTDPESEGHAFEIYIPDNGTIAFISNLITIDGISAIDEKDHWFTLDFEDEIGSSGKVIYFYIYVKITESEGEDEGQTEFAAELTTDEPRVFSEREDVKDIVLSSEVATVEIDDESKGKVTAQILYEIPTYHVPVYQ